MNDADLTIQLYLRLKQLNYKRISKNKNMKYSYEWDCTYILLDIQDIINDTEIYKDSEVIQQCNFYLTKHNLTIIKNCLDEINNYYYYENGFIEPMQINNDYYIKICNKLINNGDINVYKN